MSSSANESQEIDNQDSVASLHKYDEEGDKKNRKTTDRQYSASDAYARRRVTLNAGLKEVRVNLQNHKKQVKPGESFMA